MASHLELVLGVTPSECNHGEAILSLGKGGGAVCNRCGIVASFSDAIKIWERKEHTTRLDPDELVRVFKELVNSGILVSYADFKGVPSGGFASIDDRGMYKTLSVMIANRYGGKGLPSPTREAYDARGRAIRELETALSDMIQHDLEQRDCCGDWGTDSCPHRAKAVKVLRGSQEQE